MNPRSVSLVPVFTDKINADVERPDLPSRFFATGPSGLQGFPHLVRISCGLHRLFESLFEIGLWSVEFCSHDL